MPPPSFRCEKPLSGCQRNQRNAAKERSENPKTTGSASFRAAGEKNRIHPLQLLKRSKLAVKQTMASVFYEKICRIINFLQRAPRKNPHSTHFQAILQKSGSGRNCRAGKFVCMAYEY